jgi:Family of unknown function (DUF5675)
MKVEILRTYLPEETLSTLNVIDDKGKIVFSCKGLEPPDKENKPKISCIPEGIYLVKKEATSPGHEYPHFRVYGVPKRSGILWHGGNYYEHTLGCYLPGDSFGDKNKDKVPDVLNSRATLQKLYDLLPNEFYCTYKKK